MLDELRLGNKVFQTDSVKVYDFLFSLGDYISTHLDHMMFELLGDWVETILHWRVQLVKQS